MMDIISEISEEAMHPLDSILTLDRVIFNVFIGQGGRHCQGVTPDTGSDVRDAERQSAPFALVDQAWHDGGSVQYSFSHAQKEVIGDVSLKRLDKIETIFYNMSCRMNE